MGRDGPPIVLTLLSLAVAFSVFLATWWQASIARDAEKRSLRAYVAYDEPLVTSVPNSAGAIVEWKFFPRWANHGSTPTRNLTFVLHCISVLKETRASIGETVSPASSRDISPGFPLGAGSCSHPASQLAADLTAGILHGARSTVDYLDVFGEAHHSEQCFTVEFLADPQLNANALREIGSCERNCQDEECTPAPAPASYPWLDQMFGGRRLTPVSPPSP